MKKFISIIILLLSTSIFADDNLREFLFKKFDQKISKALSANTQSEVEAALGRPSLIEKNTIYYELESFKYAISANIKDGKVQKIYYHPRKVQLGIVDFEKGKVLDKSKIRPLKTNGVDDGLNLEYIDSKLGLRLILKTDKAMSLETVEVLK